MAARTLNLHGLSKINLEQDLIDSSFDRISRYYITARIIQTLSKKKQPRILDVGGLGTILPRLLPHAQITVIDTEPNEDPNYVQGSAMDMPFADKEFDAVITCDVFEHIPKKDREKFIQEIVRVSADLVILCAPFDIGDVADSEVKMNDFYKSLRGVEHRWLGEHIEIGIPDPDKAFRAFEASGVKPLRFGHTDTRVWRSLIEANFLSEAIDDSRVQGLIADINRYYNTSIVEADYSEKAYRQFFVASRKNDIVLAPIRDTITDTAREELFERLRIDYAGCIALLGAEAMEERVLRSEHAQLAVSHAELRIHSEKLDQELRAIKTSRGWKALNKYYNTRKKFLRS